MTELRRNVIQIRVSDSEKSDIQTRAAALHLDMSEYVRMKVLRDGGPRQSSQPVEPPPPLPVPKPALAAAAVEFPWRRRAAPVGSLLKGQDK